MRILCSNDRGCGTSTGETLTYRRGGGGRGAGCEVVTGGPSDRDVWPEPMVR